MPNALIITTAGINCDRELAFAFESAGAVAESIHLNKLLAEPAIVDRFDLIGLPGGFSYGDAIAAGRIMSALMRRGLYAALARAVDRGVPMIAPCNGFQIVAQMGLLPGPAVGESRPAEAPRPSIALAQNASARFVDRWCRVEIPPDTRCVWTQGIDAHETAMLLPVAHGEGCFIPETNELLEQLEHNGQIAIRYSAQDNPNGSDGHVAGVCDATGLILGVMPHPERYTRWTQHPHWSRLTHEMLAETPVGLAMFRNAVARASATAAV